MEYRCEDIIKILIKKWYYYLICIVLFGGLAIVLSKNSYSQAEENYSRLSQVKETNDSRYEFEARLIVKPHEGVSEQKADKIFMDVERVIGYTDEQRQLQVLSFPGSLKLILSSDEVKKDENELLLEKIMNNMDDLLEVGDVADVHIEEKEYLKIENEIVDILFDEPEEKSLSLKNLIVCIVFAIMVTSIIIMIEDYIKVSRKVRRK